jgi:TonB-linked SusC/RagA family outer membrane protein
MIKFTVKLIALLFFLLPLSSIAQIKGSVTGEDGKPLEGASVIVKGKKSGTKTNANGEFSISANNGDILEISDVGFVKTSVKIKNDGFINIKLAKAESTLDEVVVAMDIKRNPKSLAYGTQTIKGPEIAETQRSNFINSLQGRVAGLTITPTTGAAGASSSIVLRGYNSMSLSNSPLFVIDGIIMDNQTIDENSGGGIGVGLASDRPNRNNDYTNRAADINPNDIESVTVLKGPEATALYGSQASSGAIVITTKKASVDGKLKINYDNSFRFQKIFRLPQMNNEFSQGVNGNAYVAPSTALNYFGPAYPEGTQKYDNVNNFFNTGFSQTHNLGVEYGKKNVTFRLSGSFLNEKGVVPENTFTKANLRLTNTTKITKWLDVIPSISFTSTNNDKPIRGAGGYLNSLYAWPVTNNVSDFVRADGLKNLLLSNSFNVADPIDNPLWSVKNNRSQDKNDRVIASLGVNLNPTSWLSLRGRFGYDTYSTVGHTIYSPASTLSNFAQLGAQDNYWRKYKGYNHTITATAKKKIKNFEGQVMVGTMWQDYETSMFSVYGTNLIDSIGSIGNLVGYGSMYKNGVIITKDQLNPKDSNNTRPNTRIKLAQNYFDKYNISALRSLAYFGEFSINYKKLIFLTYSHRFESASVLPAANRNYNYPGIGLTLIVSDIFPEIKKTTFIDYFKLRASSASTARLNDPYSNQSVFANNQSSSNFPGGGFSYGFTNSNPNLTPEKQRTYEIGAELKLFKRVSFDIAYYNTLASNQISQGFRASYATGYVLNTQNAATTRNQGIEFTLDINPIRKKDWNWNIRFNYANTWSKVIDLPASIDPALDYYLSDTWLYQNARGGLIRGNPTTTITGYSYLRNNAGKILINPATGFPLVNSTFGVIGNRNADFTIGTLNSIRYKNWSLSFLWDLKVGGDIFNGTDMYLTTIGKSARTSDRLTPRVVEGVLNDGLQNTANPTPNNISVIPYHNNSFYTSDLNMPEEEFVQKDVNSFRLRDVTFSYMLDGKTTKKLKYVKALSFFATGNDLILLTNYTGADPGVNGNTAGSRGVGGAGFDYGNLPLPLGLNLGIRATF